MTLIDHIYHRLNVWLFGPDYAIRHEHAERKAARIAREHTLIAARLEALQANLSRGARVQRKVGRIADIISFPWTLR